MNFDKMKVIVMETSQIKKHHIVLLGDSIFDNAAYVADGFPVSRHLCIRVPDWKTTLLAVSGSTASDVVNQLLKIPSDATHLFISVGRNDALNSVSAVNTPLCDVGSALHHLGMARNNLAALNRLDSARINFQQEYHKMLKQVLATNLPVTVCTICNSSLRLGREEKSAIALFNEIILKEAGTFKLPVIDLRIICNEAMDYSPTTPTELSHKGGLKIALAVISAVKNTTKQL